jgi:hypothetical protein
MSFSRVARGVSLAPRADMTRRAWLVVVALLAACGVDDDLSSTDLELGGTLPRFGATAFTAGPGVSVDPFENTHVLDGIPQRVNETLIAPGCLGNCLQARGTWTIANLPATGGTHTVEVVARVTAINPTERFRFTARRSDGQDIFLNCLVAGAQYVTCRSHFQKPTGQTFITVRVTDEGAIFSPVRGVLVDHIGVVPGYVPVEITAPVSVPPGSHGHAASIFHDASVQAYGWTLVGGPLESSPNAPSVSFGAGPAGQTMTLQVARTYPAGTDISTRRVQVDFNDVPVGYPVHDDVVVLAGNGVTGGCGGGNYCPGNSTLRNEITVLLLRAKEGSSYFPPPATGLFPDLPATDPYAAWIEELARRGVVTDCGGGNYCPTGTITRRATAIWLLRTLHGGSYVPPPWTGLFADVPVDHPFATFIEEAYRRGLFLACGDSPLRFCPDNGITRARLATALVRNFGLSFP